ncbi:MAG: biotin/lipoyl-binding protein, partial [Bacteroidota bacterium]
MKKVALILIGLISLSSCKKDYEDLLAVDATIASSTVPVVVDSVQIVNEAIPIYAVGRVGASEETRLSFKIGGVIASMSAEEGDYVKSGQSLARLRTDEIDAQVLKAQQALTKTKRDLARIQQMYEDDAATLENVQDLTTLVEVQQADLDIAKFNQQYASIIAPISGRI